MNTEYPYDWPTCPQCGRPALDGHITCGRAECDEGRARRLRERALRKQQREQSNGKSTFCCALLCAVVITCASAPDGAHADDRKREQRHEHRESHNYIIERQQAYQVEGVPTSRLINGKREIDIYSNGLMFEKNNVVGVRK